MTEVSKARIMLELADTTKLAVAADLTNLYLVESEGVVSLQSHQGEPSQFLLGEEGTGAVELRVEQCARTRRPLISTDQVSAHCWSGMTLSLYQTS